MYQSYANNMGYSPTQMRLNQMEQMYPQYNNQMMYNNQYQGNQQLPQNNDLRSINGTAPAVQSASGNEVVAQSKGK